MIDNDLFWKSAAENICICPSNCFVHFEGECFDCRKFLGRDEEKDPVLKWNKDGSKQVLTICSECRVKRHRKINEDHKSEKMIAKNS